MVSTPDKGKSTPGTKPPLPQKSPIPGRTPVKKPGAPPPTARPPRK